MADHTDGKRVLPLNVTLPDGTSVRCDIPFPLPDGTAMVQGPLTYNSDGLMSTHSVAWMSDPAFLEAYRRGMATGHRYGDDLHIEWRVYTACWAASMAKDLDGDFVECGVNTGIYAAAMCSYIDFGRLTDKTFYLLDTYAGFPVGQWGAGESDNEEALQPDHFYFDTYDLVRQTFAEYANVVLVRGAVPETLPHVPSARIAFLSIDMNAAAPERAALDYFWEKIVPGGVILLDDYGYRGHDVQRRSFDAFFTQHGVRVLSLPTGHGLAVKPAR